MTRPASTYRGARREAAKAAQHMQGGTIRQHMPSSGTEPDPLPTYAGHGRRGRAYAASVPGGLRRRKQREGGDE